MMKPNHIKALFPISIFITQEMIDEGIYGSRENCIAANALRSVLPDELKDEIDMGIGIGRIKGVPIRSKYIDEEGRELDIYIQKTTMKPQLVKFIIDNR